MTEKDLTITMLDCKKVIEGNHSVPEIADRVEILEQSVDELHAIQNIGNIQIIPLSEVMRSINIMTADL